MSGIDLHISSIAKLPPEKRQRIIAQLTDLEAEELLRDWRFLARPEQLAPDGDWRVWLFLAGRGAGKTRSGAEWVRSCVKQGYERIALIAPTAADARDVMVEGNSGILSVSWQHDHDQKGGLVGLPSYEPSKRRLTWANGAMATLFSAEEPERLRGPQHDAIWADELAAWKDAQGAWDMAMFGLRLGSDPRVMVSTTPRPIPLIRALLRDKSTRPTRATTYANRANLADAFLSQIVAKYEGTRLGRQELQAEVLEGAPDALWTVDGLDQHRRKADDLPELRRVVVAIDPAAKTNEAPEDGAATGIVVAALGEDGRGYVLEDGTLRASPNGWARRAVALFDRFDGDCIVGEVNNGGDMVEQTIRAVRPTAPFKAVQASKGKWTRAEPIAALYEQGRVSHVGTFADLEDEMVLFTPNGTVGGASPDRVDALVWALSELFPQMTKKTGRGAVQHQGVSGYNPHQARVA
jgi:phage terminase large subunit-like protein